MVPGYEPERPPQLWREPGRACGSQWARACSQRSHALGCGQGRGGAAAPCWGLWLAPPAQAGGTLHLWCTRENRAWFQTSLLRLLCLKLSGSLRPAGMILNTLVIFGAWLFTQSRKHHLWFQGWGCPKSLFQNQLVTSAPLIYALQTSEAIFKTGFYQCMQGGATPLLFLPRSNSMDSFHTYLPV